MKKSNSSLPVYSLDQFRTTAGQGRMYQVEVFDANRHFKVSYPHRHDFYEMLFITNGTGFHIIDSNKYKINPPGIFFLSPGQAHKLELSRDIEGFIFLFASEFYLLHHSNPNRLLEFPFFFSVEQKNPPLDLRDAGQVEFIKSLFIQGCNEMQQDSGNRDEIIHRILDLLLLLCDKLYPEKNTSINKTKGHLLVKQFLYLIENNYQNNLRVNDYAELLAITPNHLTQMVRHVTGKTSIELLQDKIVLEIKRLLLYTQLNVTEVAELLHFADQSYFTKFFKKYTGVTPIQYRKNSMKST